MGRYVENFQDTCKNIKALSDVITSDRMNFIGRSPNNPADENETLTIGAVYNRQWAEESFGKK